MLSRHQVKGKRGSDEYGRISSEENPEQEGKSETPDDFPAENKYG
jgi:hypothetical protein